MKVGQVQPRADKRFLVEAFWATLKIRFILADLARTWLKALQKRGCQAQQIQMWGTFGCFLLDTCNRDADIALTIATESESRRQMTTTILLRMRTELERFRFSVEMARQSGVIRTQRLELANNAKEKAQQAEHNIRTTISDHTGVLPNDRQAWIRDNFTSTASIIVQEWQKLEKSISGETFYEPVSLDEKTAIVQAFGFCTYFIIFFVFRAFNFAALVAHTGHWYKCPAGHAFVITEVDLLHLHV